MDRKQLSMIAAACGAVVFIAMILPFGSVSAPSAPGGIGARIAAQGNPNGFDWDGGAIVLILSLLAGAAALLVFLEKTDAVPLDGRQLLFVGLGGYGVAFLLVIIKFFDGDAWKTMDMGPLGSVGMSRGIGLYLMLLATIVGGAACLLAAQKAPASGGGGGGGGDDA